MRMEVDAVIWCNRAGTDWLRLHTGIIFVVYFDCFLGHAKHSDETERLHPRIGDVSLVLLDLLDIVSTGEEIERGSKQIESICGIWTNRLPKTSSEMSIAGFVPMEEYLHGGHNAFGRTETEAQRITNKRQTVREDPRCFDVLVAFLVTNEGDPRFQICAKHHKSYARWN